MAEIYEALVTYLKAYSGLTALISTRVYPDETPQEVNLLTQPSVVYQLISDVPLHTLSGQNKLESPIYQFSAFASEKNDAVAIKNQLMLALNDYSGTLSTLKIQHIKLINKLSSVTKISDEASSIYTEILEYEVNFERS